MPSRRWHGAGAGRILPVALLATALACILLLREHAGPLELLRQVHMDRFERSMDREETAISKELFPSARTIGRDGARLHTWVSSLFAAKNAQGNAKQTQQPARVPTLSGPSAPSAAVRRGVVRDAAGAVNARKAVLRQLSVQHNTAEPRAAHVVPRSLGRVQHASLHKGTRSVHSQPRRPVTSPGELRHLPGPALRGGGKVEMQAKTWIHKIEQIELTKYRKQFVAEEHKKPFAGARHYGVAAEKKDASDFFDGLERHHGYKKAVMRKAMAEIQASQQRLERIEKRYTAQRHEEDARHVQAIEEAREAQKRRDEERKVQAAEDAKRLAAHKAREVEQARHASEVAQRKEFDEADRVAKALDPVHHMVLKHAARTVVHSKGGVNYSTGAKPEGRGEGVRASNLETKGSVQAPRASLVGEIRGVEQGLEDEVGAEERELERFEKGGRLLTYGHTGGVGLEQAMAQGGEASAAVAQEEH